MARFIEEYLPGLKPATAKRYIVSVRQLHPYFESVYLDQVKRATISDYVSERKRAGATNATIRRDMTPLSRMFACAINWEWVEHNPVAMFDKSVVRERRDPIRPPTDDDVDTLVAAAPPMMGRAIRFLEQTGMRLEEALSLEWGQVNAQRREVALTKTKTNRPRTVPLSDAALGTILGTPRHITSGYVFWHHNGERYSCFSNQFKQLAKRVGVKCRCHDLRHKFATDYLRAAGDIYRLQQVLGHSTVVTTEIYAHVLTEELHEDIKKLGTKAGTDGTV